MASGLFGDDVHDFSLHDTLDLLLHDLRDLSAYYLNHLLLHRYFDLFPNGTYNFAFHGDLQQLLHYVSDFFQYSLLYLPDVRYLVDGLLSQREALGRGVVHADDGLQNRLQPRLLDFAVLSPP